MHNPIKPKRLLSKSYPQRNLKCW